MLRRGKRGARKAPPAPVPGLDVPVEIWRPCRAAAGPADRSTGNNLSVKNNWYFASRENADYSFLNSACCVVASGARTRHPPHPCRAFMSRAELRRPRQAGIFGPGRAKVF